MELSEDDVFLGQPHATNGVINDCQPVHVSTILAPLHGNGLNLSTNHGLDLTCPSYEGLNLSLNQVYPQHQSKIQPHQPPQGLNLTHNGSTGGHAAHFGPAKPSNANVPGLRNSNVTSHSEVGLNLSIQSSGMNLTKANANNAAPHSSSNFHPQYYYTTHTSGGYINLSTQKVFENNANNSSNNNNNNNSRSSDKQSLFDNPRQSPLNFEQHRSSPLNLTSAVVSNPNPQQPQNRQYFPQQVQPDNYSTNNSNFTYQATTYNDTTYQQNVYEGQYYNSSTTADPTAQNFRYVQQQQQQQQHCNPNDQNQPSTLQCTTNRIRLFCSTCCQEFCTSAEFNKHMAKHNTQVSISNDPGHQSQHQQEDWSGQEGQQQQQQQNIECLNFNGAKSTSKVPPYISNLVSATTNNSSKSRDEPVQSCLDCSMTFASGADLKKHVDLTHSGRRSEQSFQCKVCQKSFEERAEFKLHCDQHTKEKPFQCEFCDVRLVNQAGLNRHIKRIHKKIQPYGCEECGKKYYEKHDLQRHRRSHEKANQVPDCPVCSKSFNNFYQKEKHKCKGPEGKFPCEICDKKLESKASWGYHMWRHTKDPKYINIETIVVGKQKKNEES